MKFLKIALFAFICAIAFIIAQCITGVAPIAILSGISAIVCVASLLTWVCTKIFRRFKHSLNIILVIVFLVLAIICYLFQDGPVNIESFEDFSSVSYISIAWIASTLACCISVLTLIGRLIFEKRDDRIGPEAPIQDDANQTGGY